MASTLTGRFSSNDPNIQNIPIKTEEGREIRKAFVPEKNNKIISIDYSQIELRILAHVAKVKSLQEAFKNDEDVHNVTAMEVFQVDKKSLTTFTHSSLLLKYGSSLFLNNSSFGGAYSDTHNESHKPVK